MIYIDSLLPNQSVIRKETGPASSTIKGGHKYQCVTISEKKGVNICKAFLAIIGLIIALVKKEWKPWADQQWKEAWGKPIEFKAYLKETKIITIESEDDKSKGSAPKAPMGKVEETETRFLSGEEVANFKPIQIGSVNLNEVVYIQLNDIYYGLNASLLENCSFLRVMTLEAAQLKPHQVINFSQFDKLKNISNETLHKILTSLVGPVSYSDAEIEDLLKWGNYLGFDKFYEVLLESIQKKLNVPFFGNYTEQKPAMKLAIDHIMKREIRFVEGREKWAPLIKRNLLEYVKERFF